MANVIKLVQGDSRPSLEVTLTDERSGNALNLTDTTLVLKFRAEGADVLVGEVPGAVVDPAPEPVCVPQVVTIRQAKLALLQVGLLDDVDAAVAQADRSTQIEWEYAAEVKRNWLTLLTLQTALGLSDTQVDDLFILADSL